MNTTQRRRTADGQDYRFERLKTSLILKDMRFSRDSLKTGERLPEFELLTPDGQPISSRDFIGDVSKRGFLIITGSLTCPMTVGSLDELQELYEDYRDVIPFVLLYVREAHPGENYPQPTTYEEKIEHARLMRASYELPWPVAVDSIGGTLHQDLATKPNSAYLIDAQGNVVFRALFAGDIASLREALESLASATRLRKGETQAFLGPVTSALGHINDVINAAGPAAWRDLWFAAPPMAVVAKLAEVFGSWPKQERGPALMLAIGLGSIAAVLGASLVLL